MVDDQPKIIDHSQPKSSAVKNECQLVTKQFDHSLINDYQLVIISEW